MKELIKKAQALRTAKEIGCSGAHKDKDGNWMPCESHDDLIRISDMAETNKWRSVVPGGKKILRTTGKRKKKKRDEWEKLGEMPIRGISSIEGGGLVSGNLFAGKSEQGPCWPGYKQVGMKKGRNGKMVPNCVKAETKAAVGPEYVRDNDPDVFVDPESARARARQIGCIGISRRVSKTGRAVWMPCTNMTDYANRAGTTALGRRNIEKRNENQVRRAVRTILRAKDKATLKRKVAIVEELKNK